MSWQYTKTSTLGTVTLGSGYTSGSGSMSLTGGDGAQLPSSGDFWLTYSEDLADPQATKHIWKVTARSTDTLTVTADASEGGGDTNLSAGAILWASMSISALDQLRQDISQTGAAASASSTKAGALYWPNNGFTVGRDSGSAIIPWGPLFPFTAPVNGDFSDLGSPTVSTTNGGIVISVAAIGSDSNVGRVKSISGISSATIAMIPRMITENYHGAGLVVSDGTKILCWGYGTGGGLPAGIIGLVSTDWNTITSFSGNNAAVYYDFPGILFLRYEEDTTDRILSYSADGQNFETIFSEGKTTFLTATHIGMYVFTSNATRGTLATFLHWAEA